jgi:hypothetical protein
MKFGGGWVPKCLASEFTLNIIKEYEWKVLLLGEGWGQQRRICRNGVIMVWHHEAIFATYSAKHMYI